MYSISWMNKYLISVHLIIVHEKKKKHLFADSIVRIVRRLLTSVAVLFHLSCATMAAAQINRLPSLVHVVIVFLWKINNLDQTASEFLKNLPFGCFRIVIILLTVIGLGNHTLYRRLDDIGCDEIAWFFGRHSVFRFDAVVVALIVCSLSQRMTIVLRCVPIVVVIECVVNVSATFEYNLKWHLSGALTEKMACERVG